MPVPAALAVTASVATVVGGIASVAGFFAERDENRKIIGSVEEIKRYLIDIDRKIDGLKGQNEEILAKLDKLPEDIRSIVESVVSVALLEERYSSLISIRTNYLELDDDTRARYRINTRGWDDISEALTYLVLHENRVSKVFDLLKWFEFALVASEMRGSPVVSSLVATKDSLVLPLLEELSEKVNSTFIALEALLSSHYVKSHNLYAGLSSMDDLQFEVSERRPEHRTRLALICPPGAIPNGGGCREEEVTQRLPENETFNNKLATVPASIDAAASEFQLWASYYAEVRDVIRMLNRYTQIVAEDTSSDEVRVLETNVTPIEAILLDQPQFVKLEPIEH